MSEIYPITEELTFENDGNKYRTIVSDENITLKFAYGDGMTRSIAVHTRSSGVTKWYVEHSCGLNGFDPMKGDDCYSCDNGTFHEFDPKNAVHRLKSKHSKDLERFIKELDENFRVSNSN